MDIKPNFLCVGAAKSATTSLHRYLSQHPEIFMPDAKELIFFSHKEYTKNIDGPGDEVCLKTSVANLTDYLAYFEGASTFKAIGETSPSYFTYPKVPERIYEMLGEIKILIILRNPIDRAYSNYWHMVRTFGEKICFYDALQAENKRLQARWHDHWGYLKSSKYSEMLEMYFKQFGRKNVHVILYEDFKKNTKDEMRKTFQFLGVDPHFDVKTTKQHNTTSEVRNPAARSAGRIINPFSSIAKLVLGKKLARYAREIILKSAHCLRSEDKLQPKEINYLVENLQSDIVNVERLIKRDTGWLKKYDH
jgi:hypothetical protein